MKKNFFDLQNYEYQIEEFKKTGGDLEIPEKYHFRFISLSLFLACCYQEYKAATHEELVNIMEIAAIACKNENLIDSTIKEMKRRARELGKTLEKKDFEISCFIKIALDLAVKFKEIDKKNKRFFVDIIYINSTKT